MRSCSGTGSQQVSRTRACAHDARANAVRDKVHGAGGAEEHELVIGQVGGVPTMTSVSACGFWPAGPGAGA